LLIEESRQQGIFNQQSEIINQQLPKSFLTSRAIMTAAASDHDSFYAGAADEARVALASVDAVLELEEAFFAIGVSAPQRAHSSSMR